MAPKKRRRSNTPPIASGSSPRKKQRKSAEEEAEAKAQKEQKAAAAKLKKEEKEAKKAKKEAAAEKKKAFRDSLVQWEPIHDFTFPDKTKTINKGEAKTKYKLDDTEMGTLPFQKIINHVNGVSRTTHLYSVAAVEDLSREKHGDLPATAAANYVPESRIFKPTKEYYALRDAENLRKQRAAASKYDSCLVKCLEYFVPAYEEGPDTYTPPSESVALPDNFAFRPGRRITELEAMNLFLLNRHELQGLERQPRDPNMSVDMIHFGETLDYEAVQQRAMDVHGGFEEHNTLLTELVDKLVSSPSANFAKWPKYPSYIYQGLALAPNVIRDIHEDLEDRALLEVWWPPIDFKEMDDDEFGGPRMVCAPGRCRGPDPEVPMECIPEYAPDATYPYMGEIQK